MTGGTGDFLPTTSQEMLRQRSQLFRSLRTFFDQRGYLEVDTPVLSWDIVIDANLEPLRVPVGAREMYLQTSPEFGMKRLLAAGATAIYQLSHVFRSGERGQWHNPEFMMLEWYQVGDDHQAQMTLVEELLRHAAAGLGVGHLLTELPFRRTTYEAAFQRVLEISPHQATSAELQSLARARQVQAPQSLAADDKDGWLNLLLAECIEPDLGQGAPEFLYAYPATQAALARVDPGPPPVAERFELYWDGHELCNGYHELTDPEQLRRRNVAQAELRAREGWGPLPSESRLLEAMEHGLPESAGVALGVDRLLMLLTGAESIDQVWPFPWERA